MSDVLSEKKLKTILTKTNSSVKLKANHGIINQFWEDQSYFSTYGDKFGFFENGNCLNSLTDKVIQICKRIL